MANELHYIIYPITCWQDFFLAIERYITYYKHIDIKEACRGIENCCESTYTKGIAAANMSRSNQTSGNNSQTREPTVRLKKHKAFLEHHGMRLRLVHPTKGEWIVDLEQIYDLNLLKLIYPNRFDGNQLIEKLSDRPDPNWDTLPFERKAFNSYVAIPKSKWKKPVNDEDPLPQPRRTLSGLTNLLLLLNWLELKLYLDCPRRTWASIKLPETSNLPALTEKFAIGIYNTEEQHRLILNRHVYLIRLDGKGGIEKSKIPQNLQFIYIFPTTKFYSFKPQKGDAEYHNGDFPYGMYKISALIELSTEKVQSNYEYTPSSKSTTTRYLVLTLEAQVKSKDIEHLSLDVMQNRVRTATKVKFYEFRHYMREKYGFRGSLDTRMVADEGESIDN